MEAEIRSFFVYGTLKKGQLRGEMWPCQPASIDQAVIKASLFDLGSYPGIIDGSDDILGQLWTFQLDDIPATVRALDRIEGYESLGKNNEYIRKVVSVEAYDENEKQWRKATAYSYFVGNLARIKAARRIHPWSDWRDRQVAQWPDPQSRVPARIEDE